MRASSGGSWEGAVSPPIPDRPERPRSAGVTMVIDKGMGPAQTADFLDLAGRYVDFVKFAFGSSVLYPPQALSAKISMLRAGGVHVYPGGTLLELAAASGAEEAFLDKAADLGFTCIEVSEGTIDLNPKARSGLIRKGLERGLTVLTEIGKKDGSRPLEPEKAAAQAQEDLTAGASWVIIEGRDSGVGVGVYDESGAAAEELIGEIADRSGAPERLIWEAPQPKQQQTFLLRWGPLVNLGNVHPADVITLESMRRGLRSETLRRSLAEAPGWGQAAAGRIRL